MLMNLRRSGLSFAAIGQRLRKTKGSVLSRYHRLNGIVFKSRAVHHEKARLARREAKREQAAALRERTAMMLERIASGMPRAEAIRRANQEGLSFEAIGKALKISRQAAHQAAAGRR
jgi:predicted DNA-binding protein (UPF0251 family)